MPTPIGHALAGAAVAWACDRRADWRLTGVAAALAALPDADLLTPFRHRTVSHSIGAVVIVTIIAGLVTGQVTRRSVWRVSLVCGAAYASHLLLDWLGADTFAPYGLQALWPFSDRFYISGWNVFRQTARGHMLTTAMIVKNLQAIAQEVAILGPIVAALWSVRVKTPAGLPAEMTRRHHPAE